MTKRPRYPQRKDSVPITESEERKQKAEYEERREDCEGGKPWRPKIPKKKRRR